MDKRQLCGLCAALALAAAACERPASPPEFRHPPPGSDLWIRPGEAAPGEPRQRQPLLRAPAARTIQVAGPPAPRPGLRGT